MVAFIIVQNLVEVDAVVLIVLVRLSHLINRYNSLICSLHIHVHLVVVFSRSTNTRSKNLQFPRHRQLKLHLCNTFNMEWALTKFAVAL